MKRPSYPWTFRPRFRNRGFSWRGSSLAAQRLKEAVAEIKAVNRNDPLLAADGVILLMERLWPALEPIDSSSGALGIAVGKTAHALLDILIAAPADALLAQGTQGCVVLRDPLDYWRFRCAPHAPLRRPGLSGFCPTSFPLFHGVRHAVLSSFIVCLLGWLMRKQKCGAPSKAA